MKSDTIKLYVDDLPDLTCEQVELVDDIYAACEANYDAGGDTVVECFDPFDVLESFDSVEAAKEYCGIKLEQALNHRWGSDEDDELQAMKRFEKWKS